LCVLLCTKLLSHVFHLHVLRRRKVHCAAA
jgi:hypothetical protein